MVLVAWTSCSAQVIEISGTRPLSEELGVPGDRTWLAVGGGLARPLSTFYRLPEGRHELLIIERNADGGLGESRWVTVEVPPQAAQTMIPFALHFDTEPPQIRQSSEYGARGAKPPVLVLDESGIRSVRYLVDGQELSEYFAANTGKKGAISVIVEVEDGAGNRARQEIEYEIDADGPVVEWSTAAPPIEGTGVYAAPLEVILDASDPSGVASLEILGDDPREIDPGTPVTVSAPDLRVAAVDKLGNRSENTLKLPIDDQPPELDVRVSDGEIIDGRIVAGPATSINATASDASGVASLEYRADDGRWRTLDQPVAVSAGTGRIEFRAVDRAGNEATQVLEVQDG